MSRASGKRLEEDFTRFLGGGANYCLAQDVVCGAAKTGVYTDVATTCSGCERKDEEIARLKDQVKALMEDLVEVVTKSAELDRVRG